MNNHQVSHSVTPKSIVLSSLLALGLLPLAWSALNQQLVQAQNRPEQVNSVPLLSRTCTSQNLKVLNDRPVVTIGREPYQVIFYLESWNKNYSSLTCFIPSNPSDSSRRFIGTLRLKFGLSDIAPQAVRVLVKVYKGSVLSANVTVAQKDTLKSLDIPVDDVRSVHIEADCISENCYNSHLYFVVAELKPSLAFKPNDNTSKDYPYVNNPQFELPPLPEPSPQPKPPVDVPKTIRTVDETIRTVDQTVRSAKDLINRFK